eukprot:XP_011671206.1 PREDICTED: E3 ubiquitin-protein ligase RNF34-like [Strongylocentrotus purpuratus]
MYYRCTDCDKYYCSNCFVKEPRKCCSACSAIQRSPTRAELMALKIKDLRLYLNTHSVSTQSCTEKDDLVDLVVQYVHMHPQPTARGNAGRATRSSASTSSNNRTSTTPGNFKCAGKPVVSPTAYAFCYTGAADPSAGASPRGAGEGVGVGVQAGSSSTAYSGGDNTPRRPSSRQSSYGVVAALDDDDESTLCKICMDAEIDCILLECGHMVTCTNCGKRMNECPICRQYFVRAVHIFKA